MSSKKPAKIMLCKCLYPKVYEVAEFKPHSYDDAKAAIGFYNGRLQSKNPNPIDNFYFLNTRISGHTVIVTNAEQDNYPSNDPAIIEKLQAYLEGQAPLKQGANQKRGRNDKYIDP